jgi:hypothetical protein
MERLGGLWAKAGDVTQASAIAATAADAGRRTLRRTESARNLRAVAMHRKPPVWLTPKILSFFCSILGRLPMTIQLGYGIRATPEVQSTRRRLCRCARSRAGLSDESG